LSAIKLIFSCVTEDNPITFPIASLPHGRMPSVPIVPSPSGNCAPSRVVEIQNRLQSPFSTIDPSSPSTTTLITPTHLHTFLPLLKWFVHLKNHLQQASAKYTMSSSHPNLNQSGVASENMKGKMPAFVPGITKPGTAVTTPAGTVTTPIHSVRGSFKKHPLGKKDVNLPIREESNITIDGYPSRQEYLERSFLGSFKSFMLFYGYNISMFP
jgi:hypothetical protein